MKVLYDYQIFRKQRYGGISRYFTNLIKYSEAGEAIVPCFHSKNYYYNRLIDNYDYKYESMIFENINNNISKYLTKRALKNTSFKIFHPTSIDSYFLKYLKNEKIVLTVHDLARERYPEWFTGTEAFVERRRKLIEAADHLIAVSHNTKREIVDFYGIDPRFITVVYHGLPKEFGKVNIRLRGLPERYLLYVGQRNENKNFMRFLEAYGEIMDENKDLYLLCVGGGEFTEKERKVINEFGIAKQVRQRNLNDAVLAACYKQAEAFVFPSIYEGFGIPILEAFAMKCPLLLSDIGSFREIARDAGTFFDPMSVESIREKIRWILEPENQIVVKRKVRLGTQMVKNYSLQHTYDDTMAVYEAVLKEEGIFRLRNKPEA